MERHRRRIRRLLSFSVFSVFPRAFSAFPVFRQFCTLLEQFCTNFGNIISLLIKKLSKGCEIYQNNINLLPL